MIFAKEKINTGRQPEMDLARGFAALLMVICHVGLYIGAESDRALYVFSDIIGSEPCAPVFMAMMGASMVYSRHQEPKYLLRRGLILFLGGYLLSAFRSLIPWLIWGEISEWTCIAAFFVVDILQLAGLSFMFLALLKKIKLPSWAILIISLVMVAIGQIFIANRPDIQNEWVVYFLNLFIPLNEWSCFPFLTWFFFPAFGLVLGEALQHCGDKNKLYGILLPISLIGVVYVYIQFVHYYPAYAENYYFGGNYYYMGIINVLLTALFITFFLSLWHFVGKILPNFIRQFLTFLSRNLTVFYVFSWLVISVFMVIIIQCGIESAVWMVIVLMAVVIALSYGGTHLYLLIKKKLKR